MRFVGESVKRVEDARILTGRGRYVDDVKLRRAPAASTIARVRPIATA
jgi:CO/xanthine dehydrogenase Mo-binding subunit